jgi:hypothetical protein
VGHSKNGQKAPKFRKAVKCGNGEIFGVLVPYILVYLFRHARRNVGCERWSFTLQQILLYVEHPKGKKVKIAYNFVSKN